MPREIGADAAGRGAEARSSRVSLIPLDHGIVVRSALQASGRGGIAGGVRLIVLERKGGGGAVVRSGLRRAALIDKSSAGRRSRW